MGNGGTAPCILNTGIEVSGESHVMRPGEQCRGVGVDLGANLDTVNMTGNRMPLQESKPRFLGYPVDSLIVKTTELLKTSMT
jgi:hypothetical protein